jgi:hypothetical protein
MHDGVLVMSRGLGGCAKALGVSGCQRVLGVEHEADIAETQGSGPQADVGRLSPDATHLPARNACDARYHRSVPPTLMPGQQNQALPPSNGAAPRRCAAYRTREVAE